MRERERERERDVDWLGEGITNLLKSKLGKEEKMMEEV